MTRSWIGVALLSASWLFGLGYFEPASTGIWIALLIIATVLLGAVPHCWPDRRWCALIALLLVPAAWLLPLPYKSIAILSATGLLLHMARFPVDRPRCSAGQQYGLRRSVSPSMRVVALRTGNSSPP